MQTCFERSELLDVPHSLRRSVSPCATGVCAEAERGGVDGREGDRPDLPGLRDGCMMD
jgi:hypothetical protein